MSEIRPSAIVLSMLRATTIRLDDRIALMRLFQRIMSEFAMGRFITHSGRTPGQHKIHDDFLENALDIYTTYIGLPLILNYAADWIATHANLRQFFARYPAANHYINELERNNWQLPTDTPDNHYRNLVLDALGISIVLYKLFNPTDNLPTCERYKASRALEIKDQLNLTDMELASELQRRLKPTTEPPALFYTHYNNIRTASPFITLELTILFSFIELLQTYRKIAEKQIYETQVPPWLKYQSTRIYAEDKLIDRYYFDHQGKIRITLPITEHTPTYMLFNTYGLEHRLDLPFAKWILLIFEKWEAGLLPPANFELLILEEWTEGDIPPFPLEDIILEEWTEGDIPPFPLEDIILEEWTQGDIPPFPLEHIILEEWTQGDFPPHPFEDITMEYWTHGHPPPFQGEPLIIEKWTD